VLLVHCAFSRVGPVQDGPRGLISALEEALGPEGTLVMPSMTDDDEQPFDPLRTPCLGMGIVADTFWRLPGVMRSDSPHAFSAAGSRAPLIVAPHPVDIPHGPDSPVGRVHDLDGSILLLGVGHDGNTTVHLAELLGGVRYRRKKELVAIDGGQPVRISYEEIDHCCENFRLVDEWLEKRGVQKMGTVGHAEARLIGSRVLVAAVVEQLTRDPTVFLHPPGTDDQCDEAWASLER